MVSSRILEVESIDPSFDRRLKQINEIHFELHSLKKERGKDKQRIRTLLQVLGGEMMLEGRNIDKEITSIVKIIDKGITEANWEKANKFIDVLYESITNDMNPENDTGMNPDLLFLLVVLPSGLPVYSYHFKRHDINKDEILIAALINAIENFNCALNLQDCGFSILNNSKCTIVMERRKEFTVALFTEPHGYRLKIRLNEFADTIVELLREFPVQHHLEGKGIVEIAKILDGEVFQLFV